MSTLEELARAGDLAGEARLQACSNWHRRV